MQQGKVRLVLTTALHENNEIANHVAKHGDGVKDIALWVDDAASAYRETTARGAKGVREPFEGSATRHGVVKMSSHRNLSRDGPHFRRAPELFRPVPAWLRCHQNRRYCRAPRGPEAH